MIGNWSLMMMILASCRGRWAFAYNDAHILLSQPTLSPRVFPFHPGCPIDLVCDRSAGSSLLLKPKKIEDIARAMSRSMACPLTLKTRKGYHDGGDVSGIGVLGYPPRGTSWAPIFGSP